ncbi:MAG: hypothetical protein JWQ20_1933 [Conexibacter sp.]|nr:hypothetical protein [Conexibacter sp.]
MSINYLSKLERGEANPSIRIMASLSDELDTPLSKLFQRAEDLLRLEA